MRTTITIPDDLFSRAKQRAAASGKSLKQIVVDALREALSRRPPSQKAKPPHLTTFGSGGVLPGVDLDDSAALLDVMEGHASLRR
jgi:hypothetical protein